MASVIQRGKTYGVRFRYEGRQLRVTVGASRAKAESVKLVIESTLSDLKLHRLAIPANVDPAEFIASGGKAIPKKAPLTFAEAASLWESERIAAETTRAGEAKHLRHLRALFGHEQLDRIDVQAYADHRLSQVSARTLRKELVTLKAVLKSMQMRGFANAVENDIDRLRLPADPPQPRFSSLANASDGRRALLTPAEVRALRAVVRRRGSLLIADVTDFVAFTGARRSEVCRIRPEDVDLKAKTVTITEKKRRHGHLTYRTLPIHNELIPVLARRISNRPFVFTGSVNSLASGLKEALDGTKFDLPGLGFHVLRHSAASRLLARRVPVTAVASVLGHSSPQTTLSTYAHAFDDDRRRAIRML